MPSFPMQCAMRPITCEVAWKNDSEADQAYSKVGIHKITFMPRPKMLTTGALADAPTVTAPKARSGEVFPVSQAVGASCGKAVMMERCHDA